MSPLRDRLTTTLDRLVGGALFAVVFGGVIAFGWAAWWGPVAVASLSASAALGLVLRGVATGRWGLLKSPLAAIGLLVLALGVVQLAPAPARWAESLSPKARAVYTRGVAPNAGVDEGSAGSTDRSPATLDRPATLRWIAGAGVVLAIFCVAAHYADRLSRTLLIWGGVAGGFGACTVLGIAQLLAGSGNFYGAIEPGSASAWAPSLADVEAVPGPGVSLRLASDPKRPTEAWPVTRPDRSFAIGSLPGGPGAYLTLASIALPLAASIVLQGISPRGSRETFLRRMRESGGGGLVPILAASAALGAGLVGYLSGPILAIPFAVGLLVVGLPAAATRAIRWPAIGLTLGLLAILGGGVAFGVRQPKPAGSAPLADAANWPRVRADWGAAGRMARDFPVVGAGLGSFRAAWPYYKSTDLTATNAGSGLLQWWAEAGWAGIALLATAAVWALARLPRALARLGTGDRALAYGLIGATAAFVGLAAIHGPAGPVAIAIAAGAVGGTANRWLAGGTDLFVEGA